MRRLLCLAAVHAAICFLVWPARAEGGTLQLKETIPLPGVEGRIDHMDFDPIGERLFVCALANNTLEVIDLRQNRRVHSISGLGSPQGVAYVPGLDRVFVANDKDGLCRFYDGKSYQPLAELTLGDDADNVRYDPSTKQIYAGFGNGGIAVISAAEGKSRGSIKLAAHPEAFALEKQGRRIFVNVPGAGHVAVVDRDKAAVIATWKVSGASENFPLALDEPNHRLFVGCRRPSKLVVLDTDSGDAVAGIGISNDADDVFYDEKHHRIYVVCGAGKIDIIEQASADSYKVSSTIETAAGARTGLWLPGRNTLFIAVPHRGSQPAEIRLYQTD